MSFYTETILLNHNKAYLLLRLHAHEIMRSIKFQDFKCIKSDMN